MSKTAIVKQQTLQAEPPPAFRSYESRFCLRPKRVSVVEVQRSSSPSAPERAVATMRRLRVHSKTGVDLHRSRQQMSSRCLRILVELVGAVAAIEAPDANGSRRSRTQKSAQANSMDGDGGRSSVAAKVASGNGPASSAIARPNSNIGPSAGLASGSVSASALEGLFSKPYREIEYRLVRIEVIGQLMKQKISIKEVQPAAIWGRVGLLRATQFVARIVRWPRCHDDEEVHCLRLYRDFSASSGAADTRCDSGGVLQRVLKLCEKKKEQNIAYFSAVAESLFLTGRRDILEGHLNDAIKIRLFDFFIIYCTTVKWCRRALSGNCRSQRLSPCY